MSSKRISLLRYVNPETGLEIDLSHLNEAEKKFYLQAFSEFEKNVDWLGFDRFVFGRNSALYKGERSHLDVLKNPLYLAVEDMWLRLGIRQGKIAERPAHGKPQGQKR